MKQAIFAATLLAGLAAAHADGHAAMHKRQHNRIATQHTDVTTTTTTTIWVPHPSDGPGSQPQQPQQPQQPANPVVSSASAPVSSATSANTQTTPVPQVKAAGQPGSANFDPNAWQSSQAAIQSSLIASQEAVNSKQQSINGLPPQAVPTQSAPTQSAPVQSSQPVQPVSSSSGAQPTGGAPTGGAGGSHSVGMTYYNPAGGYGSCGDTIQDDSPMVAMAASQLQCGKYLMIHGPAGSFKVKAADTCPGCAGDLHLDVPEKFAYGTIQGTADQTGPLYQNGRIPITWEWV